MTDTSAWLIEEQLPATVQRTLMGDLFGAGPSGIHLGFLRVPIGASDFTVTGVPYSYDDVAAGMSDPTLLGFSVAHDTPYILPALRQALALDPALYLEAMPWRPPGWMKANSTLDDHHGEGTLLPSMYGALADYLVRFLQSYAAEGVPVDALSPHNEPGVATNYPGVNLPEQQETAFVSGYLAPALRTAGLAPSVFGWDLSWGPLGPDDPSVASARAGTLTGLAWHCYWASAVALWNLALDPTGGPVQAPNSGCQGCTGVVTVDPDTGTVALSRDYYELGQLSPYVHRGAVRIASTNFVTYGLTGGYETSISSGLDDVTFENPDGTKVLYAYDNAAVPITFALRWKRRDARYTIPPGATTTFTWR